MSTASTTTTRTAAEAPAEAPSTVAGSLLKETDLGRAGFDRLLALAAELKAAKATGREQRRLHGRTIALIFEKNSTRTRCAFEVAAFDQGAHTTYLGPDGSHLGREESIADTARVLSRYYDGIEFRGFSHDTVEELARHATVPVWNGLTDQWHPTQMLADMLTMAEFQGHELATPDPPPAATWTGLDGLSRLPFTFVGDGRNNVARSLLVTGAMLGMDVRIAAPTELHPPAEVVELATDLARASGGLVTVTDDAHEAVMRAAFVYTDVWVSMGESDEQWTHRVPLLRPYQVNAELMAATGRRDTRFMHCLPAVHDTQTELGRRLRDEFGLHGAEVTDEVFTSAASVVFAQAENRMHTIKAVLVAALGG